MTAEARANGWRGFDGIGEKVDGGWEFVCDGMPHPMGCGERIVVTRRWTKVGTKKSGWLVTYGQCCPDETADDKHGRDLDVVLTFGPSCAEVVRNQTAATEHLTNPTESAEES